MQAIVGIIICLIMKSKLNIINYAHGAFLNPNSSVISGCVTANCVLLQRFENLFVWHIASGIVPSGKKIRWPQLATFVIGSNLPQFSIKFNFTADVI